MSCQKETKTVDIGLYRVQKITKHRVVQKSRGIWQTEFKVRWKNYKARDDTWEPVEHLVDCPMLILDYVLKKGEEYTRPFKESGQPLPRGRIPPPEDANVMKQFGKNKWMWYIPEGFEVVKKILKEILISGNKYMAVVFRHLKPGVVHVPRCLMDYFFPTEVALFIKK
jgi:hypothetical protein